MKTPATPPSLMDRTHVWWYGGTGAMGLIAVMAALLYMRSREETPYLPVPASMQTCEVSSQCLPVETRCDRCCGYDAVAVAHLEAYMDMYKDACAPYDLKVYREHMNKDANAPYDGHMCHCFTKETMPMCISGSCQLLSPPASSF